MSMHPSARSLFGLSADSAPSITTSSIWLWRSGAPSIRGDLADTPRETHRNSPDRNSPFWFVIQRKVRGAKYDGRLSGDYDGREDRLSGLIVGKGEDPTGEETGKQVQPEQRRAG